MIKLLIIADDFTGALDTGVQFAQKGVPTLVTTADWLRLDDVNETIEVLVVDIESRHIPAEDAYRLVYGLVKAAVGKGVTHFYKKTDSTLRGNIGSELTGLMNACGADWLAFIPAFPKGLRTTKDGVQYVDGVELADTVFARDPFEPVKHSSVSRIIREQTDVATESVHVGAYEPGARAKGQKCIRIFDAVTDGDLWSLGQKLKADGRLRVLGGCAGFAEMLPELLKLRRTELAWTGNDDNALIVTGSVNQITIDQMNRAGGFGYTSVTLSPEQKLTCGYAETPECGAFVQKVVEELKRSGRVMLRSVSSLGQVADTDRFAGEHGIPQESMRDLIAENIGAITARILEKAVVSNLVVSGGDTLYSIMKRLQCEGLVPVREVASGVVAAKIISKAHDFSIITKSGGLGEGAVIGAITEFIFRKKTAEGAKNRNEYGQFNV